MHNDLHQRCFAPAPASLRCAVASPGRPKPACCRLTGSGSSSQPLPVQAEDEVRSRTLLATGEVYKREYTQTGPGCQAQNVPILLRPDITGESGMVKTSPPYLMSLLILGILSGCSQNTKSEPTGWWCGYDSVELKDNDPKVAKMHSTITCFRTKATCDATTSWNCTQQPLAWCPSETRPDQESARTCSITEGACRELGAKSCNQRI
jgi:hypothetical protein